MGESTISLPQANLNVELPPGRACVYLFTPSRFRVSRSAGSPFASSRQIKDGNFFVHYLPLIWYGIAWKTTFENGEKFTVFLRLSTISARDRVLFSSLFFIWFGAERAGHFSTWSARGRASSTWWTDPTAVWLQVQQIVIVVVVIVVKKIGFLVLFQEKSIGLVVVSADLEPNVCKM